MDVHIWLAFLLASFLISLAPGPGAILAMGQGAGFGLRKAMATITGLELGGLTILAVAGTGVGTLLLASASLFNMVKVLGALYLIWLGIQQWRAAGGVVQENTRGTDGGWVKHLVTGYLTNVSNPKGIVFMMAVLPQFLDESGPLPTQLLVMAVTLLVVDTLVMAGYAGAARYVQRFLKSREALRVQGRILGGVLMGMGLSLFLLERGTEE
ncbi:LysE family translocator [Metapseudomonas otitidis]